MALYDHIRYLILLQGGKIKTKMCFYIEAKWQENPPTPEDPAVFIESSTPMKVYVQKFGGYAMTDSVWTKAANDFSKQMGESRFVESDLGLQWECECAGEVFICNSVQNISGTHLKNPRISQSNQKSHSLRRMLKKEVLDVSILKTNSFWVTHSVSLLDVLKSVL